MSENSTVAVSAVSPAVVTIFAKPHHPPARVSGNPHLARRQQRRQFHRRPAAALLGLGSLVAMVLAVYLTDGGWTLLAVGAIPAAYLLTDELLSRREVVATCSSDACSDLRHTTPDGDLLAQRWPDVASPIAPGQGVGPADLPVQCSRREPKAPTAAPRLARTSSRSALERLDSSSHGRRDRRL